MNHNLRAGVLAPLLFLTACGGDPSARESDSTGIACALEGTKNFDRTCSVTRMKGTDGTILVIGRADSGYRRLLITTDGRGVISADGAEPATVTIMDDAMIEVSIGRDRYRLPATVGTAN